MAVKALPPQDVLRQLLRYDPETGKLFFRQGRFEGREAMTTTCRRGYRYGRVQKVHYQAHRIIWKMVHGFDPDQIDHINGDQSDNRLCNLRNCDNSENSRNHPKIGDHSSKYRGVCWVKRDQRWAARISVRMRKVSLGYFLNEEDAAKAYDVAAKEYHGEFALLNFPAMRARADRQTEKEG